MERWTDEEAAIAAGMKRARMTNAQIAARLGKSMKAVAHQCRRKGAYRRLDRSGGANLTDTFRV